MKPDCSHICCLNLPALSVHVLSSLLICHFWMYVSYVFASKTFLNGGIYRYLKWQRKHSCSSKTTQVLQVWMENVFITLFIAWAHKAMWQEVFILSDLSCLYLAYTLNIVFVDFFLSIVIPVTGSCQMGYTCNTSGLPESRNYLKSYKKALSTLRKTFSFELFCLPLNWSSKNL